MAFEIDGRARIIVGGECVLLESSETKSKMDLCEYRVLTIEITEKGKSFIVFYKAHIEFYSGAS